MGLSIEEQREKRRQSRKEETKNHVEKYNNWKNKPQIEKQKNAIHVNKKLPIAEYACRGIYALYRGSKIVYIGMSADNCLKRISQHYSDKKKFTRFGVKPCKKMDLKSLKRFEARLIRYHQPEYNKTHNRTEVKLVYGHGRKS